MNSVDQELSSSDASAVEVRGLLEENARLRSLLIAHSIPIPEAAQPTLQPTQALNAAPEVRKPGVATAEQRIALDDYSVGSGSFSCDLWMAYAWGV